MEKNTFINIVTLSVNIMKSFYLTKYIFMTVRRYALYHRYTSNRCKIQSLKMIFTTGFYNAHYLHVMSLNLMIALPMSMPNATVFYSKD